MDKLLEPVTKLFPQPVQDFLSGGGWWLIVGLLALTAVLFVWRGLGGGRRKGHRAEEEWSKDAIDLAKCPMPPGAPGDRRLLVYEAPARLRLVVVAPVAREFPVEPRGVPALLDKILPGLGDVLAADRPAIQVWKAQLSHHGFANTFHRSTVKPEGEGRASRWILVAGRAKVGKQPVLLGLGAWADGPNTVGRLTLDAHEWADTVRLGRAED
jgi:hypothetical protein